MRTFVAVMFAVNGAFYCGGLRVKFYFCHQVITYSFTCCECFVVWSFCCYILGLLWGWQYHAMHYWPSASRRKKLRMPYTVKECRKVSY